MYKVRNSAGTVQSHYRYRAWGDRYNVSTENVASPFTYKGAQEDRETGLIYMRYRYYSPRLERFVNEDPVGVAGGHNVYAFGKLDPCNRRDSFGLTPTCDESFDQRLSPAVVDSARQQVNEAEQVSNDAAQNSQDLPWEIGGFVGGEDGSFSLRPKAAQFVRPGVGMRIPLDAADAAPFAAGGGTIYHTHTRTTHSGRAWDVNPSYEDLTQGRNNPGLVNTSFIFHAGGAFRIQWQDDGSLDRIDACSF